MPNSLPTVDEAFVDRFNTALSALGSFASIAMSSRVSDGSSFALLDDDGYSLALFPSATPPEAIVVAYRLYQRGIECGLRGGEEVAWLKLRNLIGAAANPPPSS